MFEALFTKLTKRISCAQILKQLAWMQNMLHVLGNLRYSSESDRITALKILENKEFKKVETNINRLLNRLVFFAHAKDTNNNLLTDFQVINEYQYHYLQYLGKDCYMKKELIQLQQEYHRELSDGIKRQIGIITVAVTQAHFAVQRIVKYEKELNKIGYHASHNHYPEFDKFMSGQTDPKFHYHIDNRTEYPRLLQLFAKIPFPDVPSDCMIVDAGCSIGLSTYLLAQKYPKIIIAGLDIDPHVISIAKERYPELTFIVGDFYHVENISFQKPVYMLVFGNNISNIMNIAPQEQMQILFQKLHILVKNSGYILILEADKYLLMRKIGNVFYAISYNNSATYDHLLKYGIIKSQSKLSPSSLST